MKCKALLLLLLAVSHEGARYRSDYSFVSEVDGWLKLQRVPANWHEARLRCHLEGGVLASPLNNQMSLALKSLMSSNNVTCGLFTGIHATFSRGDFVTVEGVPLARIPVRWAAGEPDNQRHAEQCLLMLPDATLADVPCSETLPYACYRKMTPDLLLNACGTFDNVYVVCCARYELDSSTGSCYKFHTTPRTWSRAYMACAAEGGHLVVINSDTEASVIKALFTKYKHLITSLAPWGKEIVYVGFHDRGEPGEWLTVHGQTLQQAGYSTWHSGRPNNATGGQFCGSVHGYGGLDDLWCENIYNFICEKAPDSLLWDDQWN